MGFLETIKKVFFDESSISQEIVIEEMKEKIKNLKSDYENLISLQEEFKLNPRDILKKDFIKKEKYIELMDHVKFKNVELIKEHEYWGMKYNILIELYKKLKSYISNIDGDILLQFNTDKYKQPVAIISPCGNGQHNILLIKNTYSDEDYIKYNINENSIIIIDIYSKEPNVKHGTYMMEMLCQVAKYYKGTSYPNMDKIIVSEELIKRLYKFEGILFFQSLGFKEDDKVLTKKVLWNQEENEAFWSNT